jgi:ethanolamine ammonia-lyase large subunit
MDESLAMFQNIATTEYRNIIVGSEDIESAVSAVSKCRKRVESAVKSRSRIGTLAHLGMNKIFSDRLNQNPSTDEVMSIAYSSRGE